MNICPKCQSHNLPGRLFCGGCGEKLDLSAMTDEHFAAGRTRRRWIRRSRLLIPVAVIWVLVCIVLALWPNNGVLGDEGTRVGALRAERQFQVLEDLAKGRSISVWLAEEDLNAYFHFFGNERLAVHSVSVDLLPAHFSVRVIRTAHIGLGPLVFAPRTSTDLLCVPVGGRLLVRRTKVGHLRLWRLFQRSAVDRVSGLFAGWDELETFRKLSGIVCEEGKIEFSLQR